MTPDIPRSWLRHWHSVIDEAFGRDAAFDFEAALKNPDSDFRMHFMTWELPDASLRRCFDVLPCGMEICNRALEMRAMRRNPPAISESAAIDYFQRGVDGLVKVAAASLRVDDLKKPIRVERGTAAGLNLNTPRGDRIAIVLEYMEWESRLEPEAKEAHYFLSETLYRLANSYDVADYVDWPLFVDPRIVDPFRTLALLALSGRYYPVLANGPLLLVVTDRGASA